MEVDAFSRKYVRLVGIRRALLEYANGDCVILSKENRKCTVYEDRPRQCRTWPFWKSNLRTRETWAETCRVCPGSGKGKLYQVEEIDEQLAIVRV